MKTFTYTEYPSGAHIFTWKGDYLSEADREFKAAGHGDPFTGKVACRVHDPEEFSD